MATLPYGEIARAALAHFAELADEWFDGGGRRVGDSFTTPNGVRIDLTTGIWWDPLNDEEGRDLIRLASDKLGFGTYDQVAIQLGRRFGVRLNGASRGAPEPPPFDEIPPWADAEPAPDTGTPGRTKSRRKGTIARLTEDSIAVIFAAQFRDQLRFDHHSGSWHRWDGTRWRKEETRLAFDWVRTTCRDLSHSANANVKLAAILGKASTAGAVERFAQADRAFAVTSEIWDRDPFLLGTPGGTVDLRTGHLRPAQQSDFITQLTSVAPAETPDCPLWLKFLEEATREDRGMIRFLQQWLGYTLTGDIREHALLFVYGTGGNGKGVLLNTIAGILADYCRTAPMEAFTASGSDRHPTELAMLRGARMVYASETEEGRAWAESRIKQLTGGDRIAARFMRQDFFEYYPQFKLTIIGNNKPVLRNVDDAARRRFNMAAFINKPPVPDKQLEQKLRAEWPAILRWLIDGCLDWQMNGLVRPKAIEEATAAYFSEQDTLRQWIEDCCETDEKSFKETNESLFASWRAYASARGEEVGTAKRFSTNLQRFGFEPIRNKGIKGRGWAGIRVRMLGGSEDP
jgi:putative DNA primase/helicase